MTTTRTYCRRIFSGEVAGSATRPVSEAAFVIAARASDVTGVRHDANFKVR
jgi:hypothetical protein